MGYFNDRYGDDDDDDYMYKNDPTGYHAHWDVVENKFVAGTRKCSCCLKYKDKADFNKEQAAKPASKRICTECGAPLPSDLSILTIAQIKVELKRCNAAVPLTGKKAVYVDALNHAVEDTNEVNSDKENQAVAQPTTEPQPLPEYLNKLTVVRLKQELKTRGLKVSGLKAELTARLSQATGIPVMKDLPEQQASITPVANESSDDRVALAMVPPASSGIPSEVVQSRMIPKSTKQQRQETVTNKKKPTRYQPKAHKKERQAKAVLTKRQNKAAKAALTKHKSNDASATLSKHLVPPPPPTAPPRLIFSSFFESRRATLQLVKNRLIVFNKEQLKAQLAHGIETPVQTDGALQSYHGDTPLIAATRGRNVPVVRYLLRLEADPTLETASQQDDGSLKFETAADVAHKMRSIAAEKSIDDDATQSLSEWDEIVALLAAAEPFWSPCRYSGAQYSEDRKTPTNKPYYPAVLQKALSMVPSLSSSTLPDDSKVTMKVSVQDGEEKEVTVTSSLNPCGKPPPKLVDSKVVGPRAKGVSAVAKKSVQPVVQFGCLKCKGRKGCTKNVSAKCSFGCCGNCCKNGIGEASGRKKCTFKNHRK